MTPLESVAGFRDTFEQLLGECADGILLKSELRTKTREARSAFKQTLASGSRAFRVFDRLSAEINDQSIPIHDDARPKLYADSRDCLVVRKWLELTNAVLVELDPSTATVRVGNQHVLPAGDEYEATRKVLRVVKLSQRTLDIEDPYLDDRVFDLIDALDDSIAIRLITGSSPKQVFVRLISALRVKRANVAARSSAAFHDRFVILDGREVWHLGASLNGLGKATSMISRIVEDSERLRVLQEFESAWTNGSTV